MNEHDTRELRRSQLADPAYIQARAGNMIKGCSAPGCNARRYGLNAYCRAHYETSRRYGHPTARPLRRSCWSSYRVAIQSLFDLNQGHRGLVDSVAYLHDWMTQGANNANAYRGADEARRLIEHGVTARQVLVEVTAVSMYLTRHPNALPDAVSEEFAIARAVFALAPQRTKVSWQSGRRKTYRARARASALRYVGRHLRQVLSGVVSQAILGVEARAKAQAMTQAEIDEARRAPFAIA